MKSQNNIFFWDTRLQKGLGYRRIFLNINFVVVYTQVVNRTMHAAVTIPTNIHQLIAVMFIIKNK